jgi:hypothetical protein
MRTLAAITVLVLAGSVATAADTDADKAKDVTLAFLKAVKAKDVDAVMKTVDAPFVFDYGATSPKTVEKADDLKAAVKALLEDVEPEKIPTEVGTVYDMAAFAKLAAEKGANAEADKAVKLVGKSGYVVTMKAKNGREIIGIFVRIKDGKALVAGIPK